MEVVWGKSSIALTLIWLLKGLRFALASHRMNVGHKVYLRTYAVRHQPPSAITIVEAILATCASQPEFLPACVNSSFRKQEYVGADLGASNPVRQVISEASSYFERGSSISLLLSLGSGHPGVFAFSPNGGNDALYRLMQELIVDNQQRALEIQENMNHISAYFRFSVEQGMQRNQHGDSEELSWIAAQTDSYLTTPEMVKKMDECVEKLSARFGIVSLDQLSMSSSLLFPIHLLNIIERWHRRSKESSSRSTAFCASRFPGIRLREAL